MSLAPLTVGIPLLLAAALVATDFASRRAVSDVVGVLTAAAVTTMCAILLAKAAHGPVVYWFGGWTPRHGVALGISFTIDVLGAATATLVSLLVTAALVYSSRYFDEVGSLFQALMLVFMAAMVGFALTGDLFNLFVFFELMSGAAYALTAYKIEERGPLQGAINFAVSNSLAAFVILIGIGLVYARTGALNLAQIGAALSGRPADSLVLVAMLLILGGFLVKAAAVPFHFWLADAHAVAPTPVCVLFSGVMVELGLYAVARIYWTAFGGALAPQAVQLRTILVVLGAVTALVGAVMCFEQRHLKRLLAFSTVSHVGLFLAGIALLTPVGLAGAAVYIAAHGLAKGALFMAVGVLLHRFAEVDALALRGRGRGGGLRLCGVVFAVGALVIAGTPMLGCFVGKSLIEAASLEHGYAWLPALFTIASALTGGAILRVTGTVFAGWGPDAPRVGEQPQEHDEEFETLQPHDRTPAVMLVPAVVLMAGAIVVGLVGGVVHGAERAAVLFVDRAGYAATVLSGARAPLPRVEPTALTTTDFLYGTASVTGAIAVAALALFGGALLARVPAAVARPAGAALRVLRSVHSGHVGDYVAWITAGLAALGAAFTLALR